MTTDRCGSGSRARDRGHVRSTRRCSRPGRRRRWPASGPAPPPTPTRSPPRTTSLRSRRSTPCSSACDAVALAVAPAAQPDLAVAAARGGQGAPAREAAGRSTSPGPSASPPPWRTHGVGSIDAAHVPVRRRRPRLPGRRTRRDLARRARLLHLRGVPRGRVRRSGWRLELGAVLDVGPHILDLVEAALGPVADLTRAGRSPRLGGGADAPRERRPQRRHVVVRERDRAEPHRGRALRT